MSSSRYCWRSQKPQNLSLSTSPMMKRSKAFWAVLYPGACFPNLSSLRIWWRFASRSALWGKLSANRSSSKTFSWCKCYTPALSRSICSFNHVLLGWTSTSFRKVSRAIDVKLQIRKHLARDAHPTVAIIDEYCAEYKDLFKEVRNYECFKYLHLGIIAPIKRKSLPEIAKVVRINSAQSLHHREIKPMPVDDVSQYR